MDCFPMLTVRTFIFHLISSPQGRADSEERKCTVKSASEAISQNKNVQIFGSVAHRLPLLFGGCKKNLGCRETGQLRHKKCTSATQNNLCSTSSSLFLGNTIYPVWINSLQIISIRLGPKNEVNPYFQPILAYHKYIQ